MKKTKYYFLLLFLVAILISGCTQSQPTGELDVFAACLTEKGFKMYGTEWCSHCQDQKAMFGSSFANIEFIDCDIKSVECTAAGVNGYPTWIAGDGELLVGTQRLEALAKKSNCELP